MKHAEGKWFCFLDADDEYVPEYLEEVNNMIKENPDYKVFNFGTIYQHDDGGTRKRAPFTPEEREVGHESFGGGNIVKGCYVFSREIYDEIGGFPPERIKDADTTDINYGGIRDLYMGTPYDFAAYAQLEFPEIRKFFMVDHKNEPNKIIKELGNPWGDDYFLFYKITRKYHSKPVEKYLYIVHPR